MGWTKEQQQAIDVRNANLLVSAAAGSGKTAVLVERIIKMVCEEDYDIDRILVVTFTKAAAAEMKERIGKRLLEESLEHPENRKIQEQLSYIHRAPISTIHSFCTNLLRNHFHMISLDPGFRVGEQGEVALLKEQVLDELLELCYEEHEEAFLKFVAAYSYGKDDRRIGEMILRLFDFSVSHPMPEKWLKEALQSLVSEEKPPAWLSNVMEYGDRILEDAVNSLDQAIEISQRTEVLREKYAPFLIGEKADILLLKDAKTYEERVEAYHDFAFKRIPVVRTKDLSIKEKQEEVKAIRDEVKTIVLSLKKDCYFMKYEDIKRESEFVYPYMETLIHLTMRFSQLFLQAKLEKNMLEFHDLEHFTLKLLISDFENGNVTKTALAKELSRQYQAVFTDEYQDSNLIQEVILKAVSREEDGNRFMVGDIKQSIYRFRMARPEIFLEKYEEGRQNGLHKNIELKNNFRSRPEVLYSINYIFYQIMKPSLGDVLYEKKVALTPPECMGDNPIVQEVLLLDQEKDAEDSLDFSEFSVIEAEAKMVAERIKEMKEYDYRDMVILLRTMEGWAQVFENALTMEGIPVHAESKTGYFDSFEIRILLNLLSVVDNIYQDIPMAAVLRSPIGGFSGEDMAMIRSLVLSERRAEDSLYDEMIFYLERGDREDIKEKIVGILDLLNELREEKTRLSLPELIWSLLDKTDYYHLVGSMPNGQQRMANIRMFLEKAAEYEKTSFKGVFHFIQYMEQIRTYEIDYGEAVVLGEEANVVRIMSIHKSKGLEFPVVFLSGLGKKFNMMDQNQRMILHPDYYVGLDVIDLEMRTKRPTMQKQVIKRQISLATLGEELRVLYVGMTRARDKLILTGAVDDFAKWIRKYGARPSAELTFSGLSKAGNYLKWIFPALMRDYSMDDYRASYNVDMPPEEYFSVSDEEPVFKLYVKKAKAVFLEEVKKEFGKELEQKDFLAWVKKEHFYEETSKIQEQLSWVYPKKSELKTRNKWSVSQLKEECMEESLFTPVEETKEVLAFPKEKIVPKFLGEKKEESLTGAARGTAVHRLMEMMSFGEAVDMGLDAAIKHLVDTGSYPAEYLNILPKRKIEWFLNSNLGRRLIRAEKSGNLFKEAQFMIGVPMKEMEPETTSEEMVLVQGIIDLYMVEDGEIVLLDYKTDYVGEDGEEVLLGRYKAQLLWYKKALEQMTGMNVKETIIYSFGLGKAIKVLEE